MLTDIPHSKIIKNKIFAQVFFHYVHDLIINI